MSNAKNPQHPPVDIGAALEDTDRILRAMRKAVREALRQHKLLGNPVAEWRDGRVVWIPAEEIVIENEPEE